MRNLNGYIKIHRKLLNWGWYSDPVVRGIFQHLLLIANFKESQWMGRTLQCGQVATSFANLAAETGFSIRQTRTALDKLKSTGEVTTEPTSKYTIITIENWGKYQCLDDDSDKQDDTQMTNKRQAIDKQATSNRQQIKNKRNKEIKNKRNIEGVGDKPPRTTFKPPSAEEVEAYCLEKGYSVDAERFVNYYESIGWMVGKNKMKKWKNAVATWAAKDGKKKVDETETERRIKIKSWEELTEDDF